MPVLISAPERTPRPRATALTTYLPLLDDHVESPGASAAGKRNRWAFEGVQFIPYGCNAEIFPQSNDPCEDDADDFIDTPSGFGEPVVFPPFNWQLEITCSLLSMTGDDLEKQLDVLFENELSPIFAEQVEAATLNPSQPSLISEGIVYPAAGVDTPKEAVSAVEDQLAQVWRGSVGMIHMTPGTLFEVRGELDFIDGRYFTPSGHYVVADSGYNGLSPASGADVDGEAWVYGSSPVHFKYMTTDWFGLDFENRVVDRNVQVVRAHGIGIVAFEPCSVVAVRIDRTPS
jgi:hypothetical protein